MTTGLLSRLVRGKKPEFPSAVSCRETPPDSHSLRLPGGRWQLSLAACIPARLSLVSLPGLPHRPLRFYYFLHLVLDSLSARGQDADFSFRRTLDYPLYSSTAICPNAYYFSLPLIPLYNT